MEVGQDKELSPKLLSQDEVTHNINQDLPCENFT
jgi:hypothetical protein